MSPLLAHRPHCLRLVAPITAAPDRARLEMDLLDGRLDADARRELLDVLCAEPSVKASPRPVALPLEAPLLDAA